MSEIPTFPPKLRQSIPFIVLIVVGAFSGIVGTLTLFWAFPEFRKAQIPPGTQSVIVESPGTVIVEEGTKVNDVALRANSIVGQIYKATSIIKVGNDVIYQQPIGNGVLVTDDGWFATTSDANLVVGDIFVVQDKSYKVSQVVVDNVSKYVLGKVTNGRFSSVRFSDDKESYIGATVVALTASGDIVKTMLSSTSQPSIKDVLTFSSDKVSSQIRLSDSGRTVSGAPVFSLGGSLIGLAVVDNTGSSVLPSSALSFFLEDVLRFGKARHPYLGVNYVSLVRETNDTVFLIYGGNKKAIIAGSPAAKGGLLANDVIVAINSQKISAGSTLFDLIQKYNPRDSFRVTIERNGKNMDVDITLGELSPSG